MKTEEQVVEVINHILETEYSKEFDEKRQRSMVNSFYKYGPAKDNYGRECTPVSATQNIEARLKKWKETKNKDYLIDIANFAMLAFIFEKGTLDQKDEEDMLEGISVNEMKAFFREKGDL